MNVLPQFSIAVFLAVLSIFGDSYGKECKQDFIVPSEFQYTTSVSPWSFAEGCRLAGPARASCVAVLEQGGSLQFEHPSGVLQGSAELPQLAGPWVPAYTSSTPTPSQAGLVAASSLPALLPLAAVNPFL